MAATRGRMPVAAGVLAAVLVLTGCAPGGSDEPGAGELVLPDIDEVLSAPVQWKSGILEVFDDVAVLTPEIAPLREAFEAEEARYGEELFGGGGDDEGPQASAPTAPGPVAAPTPGGRGGGSAGSAGPVALSAAARAGVAGPLPMDYDASAGASFMVGSMAPEMLNTAFIQDTSWADQPAGTTRSDGKGQSVTKLDDRNAAVEMTTEHQEVKNETIVKTRFRIKMEGTMCPAADGNFDVTFTVEQFVTATTRTGESWEQQTLIVNAVGRLGENAIPERYDLETSQTTMQKHADGRTGYTSSTKSRNDLNFREMDADASTIIGQEGFTQSELDALTKQGDQRALSLALGQMFGLFKHWLLGGCVQIEHDAPSRVDAGSTTDVTVKTLQRATKAEVRSQVTLKLDGEESINPSELVSTGGFHYVAGEPDTRATVTIEATSRQGGDRKKIVFEVGGGAWLAIGGTDGYLLTEADHQVICDLSTFGVIRPGSTATDMVGWVFTPSDTSFNVQRGMTYSRVRTGTWDVVTDKDGRPVAIEMSYSEGFELIADSDVTDLGSGSGHFDLKPIPRPAGCDG